MCRLLLRPVLLLTLLNLCIADAHAQMEWPTYAIEHPDDCTSGAVGPAGDPNPPSVLYRPRPDYDKDGKPTPDLNPKTGRPNPDMVPTLAGDPDYNFTTDEMRAIHGEAGSAYDKDYGGPYNPSSGKYGWRLLVPGEASKIAGPPITAADATVKSLEERLDKVEQALSKLVKYLEAREKADKPAAPPAIRSGPTRYPSFNRR